MSAKNETFHLVNLDRSMVFCGFFIFTKEILDKWNKRDQYASRWNKRDQYAWLHR